MKYFWTLFWTFILIQMVVYVGSSMMGVEFDFNTGLIITLPVALLLYIIPAIIPNDPVEKH
ncbi:YjzD family protein [Neobacillus sp. LXY-4]|uniref:YjzD family protein n=1 Tax=Neobacillus sp. LXY-4 TaxID=3379826 RepID=UPI003EE279C2